MQKKHVVVILKPNWWYSGCLCQSCFSLPLSQQLAEPTGFSFLFQTNWKKIDQYFKMHEVLRPWRFHTETMCWLLALVTILNTVHGKMDIEQFENAACPSMIRAFLKSGEQEFVLRLWRWGRLTVYAERAELSQHLAVSQGPGNRSQNEWHLSWSTSGFRSEPSPRATRGFHRGYMLQGRPLAVRRKPEAMTPPTASGVLDSLHLTHFQPW